MDLDLNGFSNLKKGDKVWFLNNKKAFTVRACNDRFAICTQPYNFRPQTVVYTIIDLEITNIERVESLAESFFKWVEDNISIKKV